MWALQAVGGRCLHCSVLSVTPMNTLHLLLCQFDCSRRLGLEHNILQISPLVLQVHSTSSWETQCWPIISDIGPYATSFHLGDEHCNFFLAPSSYPPTPVAQTRSSPLVLHNVGLMIIAYAAQHLDMISVQPVKQTGLIRKTAYYNVLSTA